MKRVLALLALCLVSLSHGGVALAYDSQKYFPLNPGNTWTFDRLQYGERQNMSVNSTSGGIAYVTNIPVLGNAWLGWSGNTLYVWDSAAYRWEPLFLFGAATGTSYTVDLPNTALWHNVRITVEGKGETVYLKQLDRHIPDCVRFSFVFPQAADVGLVDVYFAPGHGIVRYAETTFAGPVDSELTSAVLDGRKWGLNYVSENLEQGAHTGYTIYGTNQIRLINTLEQWKAFYAQHRPGVTPPRVDFSRRTALVVLAGQRPNPAYTVKVDKVVWNYPIDSVTVHVDEIVHSGMVTQVVATPYHIVVLDKKVYRGDSRWKVIQSDSTEQ